MFQISGFFCYLLLKGKVLLKMYGLKNENQLWSALVLRNFKRYQASGAKRQTLQMYPKPLITAALCGSHITLSSRMLTVDHNACHKWRDVHYFLDKRRKNVTTSAKQGGISTIYYKACQTRRYNASLLTMKKWVECGSINMMRWTRA